MMRVALFRHPKLLASLLAAAISLHAGAQVVKPAQIVPFRSTPIISASPASASTAPQAAVKTAATGGGSSTTGQVWLQFINADIATVARSLGAMTDRQVLVDSRVEGQMNLQSTQPVPPSVAWDMFSQALQAKKLSIVLSQGAYLIAPQTAQSKAASEQSHARPTKVDPRPDKKQHTVPQAGAEDFEISVEWARTPQPTLPNPMGSVDQVRLATNEPSAIWTLMTQDKTLYHSLSRWAQVANWQLMWEAERDFPIQAQISIDGNFTAAIQLVMNSLASTDYPLQAVMNDATRVISIIRHQDPFAR